MYVCFTFPRVLGIEPAKSCPMSARFRTSVSFCEMLRLLLDVHQKVQFRLQKLVFAWNCKGKLIFCIPSTFGERWPQNQWYSFGVLTFGARGAKSARFAKILIPGAKVQFHLKISMLWKSAHFHGIVPFAATRRKTQCHQWFLISILVTFSLKSLIFAKSHLSSKSSISTKKSEFDNLCFIVIPTIPSFLHSKSLQYKSASDQVEHPLS